MEFFCVLSVGGSLASYHVQKEGEDRYKATLKPTGAARPEIPTEIVLRKEAGVWQADPWHKDIVQSLINAIESKTQ